METALTLGSNANIDVNDVTLCYDDFGTGQTPLIFIHGFPFDKSSWQPQMDFFKKTRRVIAYDIRGFGKSGGSTEKESMSLFADDLLEFMNALKINSAIVCGLSMGGFILLNAVNRFPGRFDALILCDTQCIADSSELKKKRNETIVEIRKSGIKKFTTNFIEAVFCRKTLDTKQELVERVRGIVLATTPDTIIGGLGALALRWDMCSLLNKIAVPTLVICGTKDIVTPPSEADFLHENIVDSTLFMIEDAGHLSNLEQPEVFNKHLGNFISGLKKR